VTSDSTGVLWNDEMNDFSLPGLSDYFGFVPSPANYIEPGKRPMSATSPIVIFNSNGSVEDVNVSFQKQIIILIKRVMSVCMQIRSQERLF
jgi:gamma-glutamyltranspeptidase